MGYQCTAGYKIAPGIFEVYVKESTDIAQLMCSGHLFMMDRKDLVKAKEGMPVYAAKLNVETGRVIANKYSMLPDELSDGEWIDHIWTREYESERDWS